MSVAVAFNVHRHWKRRDMACSSFDQHSQSGCITTESIETGRRNQDWYGGGGFMPRTEEGIRELDSIGICNNSENR